MRVKCPGCQNHLDLPDNQGGHPIQCPYCQMALKTPNPTAMSVLDDDPPPSPPPAQPIFIVQAHQSRPGYVDPEEERADRREIREERAQLRRERTEDRFENKLDRDVGRRSNPLGLTGFACGATALVLVLSGLLFQNYDAAKVYFGMTTCLSFPVAVVGLITSLIGLGTRSESNKKFAICGAIIGGILLLILIPIAFISNKNFH